MSRNALNNLGPSPSTAPPSSNPNHDFISLASTLQEAAQVLLNYSENCEASSKESVREQAEQAPDSQKSLALNPSHSNQTKRSECHKEFCYNPFDNRAFADKEMAQFFAQEYKRGNFRDEIRYYYVPSRVVQYEYKLLRRHRQKEVMDLLDDVHTELDLRSKLLTYIAKDTDFQDHTLTQLSESIVQSLQILRTIHNHLNSLKLIHKRMLPRPHKR